MDTDFIKRELRLAAEEAGRSRVAWTDIGSVINGKGDLAKMKSVISKTMGKKVADSGRMIGLFTYSDYQVSAEQVAQATEALKRAGFRDVAIIPG